MAEADVFLTVFSTGIGLHSSLIVNPGWPFLDSHTNPDLLPISGCPAGLVCGPIVQTLCTHAHTLRVSKVGSLTHHQNMLGINSVGSFFRLNYTVWYFTRENFKRNTLCGYYRRTKSHLKNITSETQLRMDGFSEIVCWLRAGGICLFISISNTPSLLFCCPL